MLMNRILDMAKRCSGKSIQCLRRDWGDIAQSGLSKGSETLTLTEEIVEKWKKHFEELLNPVGMPFFQEAVPETYGKIGSISVVEIAKAVENFCSGKAAGVDEICPEMLKSLDNVGVL
ncbi:unnamed protein product [Caretta caretta]